MGLSKAKRLLLVWVLVMTSVAEGYGQTLAEFLRQKKTQQRYLLEQIAALKLYAGYAQKGYELVSDGLEVIRGITGGELGLHDAFLSSLKLASPVVRSDSRVAEIITMQLGVLSAAGGLDNNEFLPAEDRKYIRAVSAGIRGRCLDELEILLMVITSGRLEMEEKERLSRIGEIYDSMNELYGFLGAFSVEVQGLAAQREQELSELIEVRRVYEK